MSGARKFHLLLVKTARQLFRIVFLEASAKFLKRLQDLLKPYRLPVRWLREQLKVALKLKVAAVLTLSGSARSTL